MKELKIRIKKIVIKEALIILQKILEIKVIKEIYQILLNLSILLKGRSIFHQIN